MADKEKRIKAVFQVDSTGFNNSLKNINSSLKNSQSELKLASEGIKTFGKDSEKLKGVQESLTRQIDLQSKKVNIYKDSIEKTSKKLEENIKARDKLKDSLEKANKKYDEAVKLYGKESEQAKKAKEEVDKLTEEYKKKEKAVETNTRSIQNYETNMNKANAEMVKAQGELQKVNGELDKSNNKWLNASEGLKKSSEKLKDVGGKISSAGDSILKITAPLAAGGIASLKFATDFADGMAKVSTIADTTVVPIDKLREGALKLSKDFGVGATEITESMYQAISASVPTEKAVNFVAVATKAAKGGFTDAATAVDGLSTVLNSYGIEADKADKIANQMLITQNKGKTSFGELASAVGKVTPVAANLGITTEELFSSLASTTAQGLATSESVTALKAAMSNIIKPSKEAGEAAEQMGIDFSVSALKSKGWKGFLEDVKSGLENASPEFKRLQDNLTKNVYAMADLEKQGKKNSEEYKKLNKESKIMSKQFELMAKASDSPVGAMATMFGSVEGLNSILMLTSENGMKIYNETMEEMKTNTHALDDAFNKMSNTPGEKFKKSLNSMKVAAIKFGDALVPMMDKGTQIISKLADALNGLSKEQMESYAKWGMLAIASGGALKVIGGGISTIGGVIGKVSDLTKWMGLAKTATTGVGTAASVAGGAGGLAGLGTAIGGAVVAAAPFIAVAGGVALAAYGIHKTLSKEVVPSVDLFADKVETTTKRIGGANLEAVTSYETTTIKISETTKKNVGAYMELDTGAKKHLDNLYLNNTIITDKIKDETSGKYKQMSDQIIQGYDKQHTEQYKSMQDFFSKSSALSDKEEKGILINLQRNNQDKKLEQQKYQQQIQDILNTASSKKRKLTEEERLTINNIQQKMKTNAIKTLSETEIESKVILERAKEQDKRITAEQVSEHIKKLNEQRDKAIKAAEDEHSKRINEIIRMRDESKTITKEQADALIKESERQKNETINNAKKTRNESVNHIMNMNTDLKSSVDDATGKILTKWDKLKRWWSNWSPGKKNFDAEVTTYNNQVMGQKVSNGKIFGVSSHWTGSNFFKGGLTTLHERGEEIYDLPKGTRIYNAERSEQLVMQTAESVAEKVANSVLKNFQGLGSNNTDQTITVIVPIDGREVARATAKPMSEELGKLNRRGGLGYV